MADRAYNISVNFKTSTQLEPIKQTEKALKDVASAGKAAGDQATAGLKKIEDEAAKAAKKLREVKASGGGSGSAGGGAGGGGDALGDMLGNFGGGLGSLMPMIDMGAAMEQAASLGRAIGGTIGKAMEDSFVQDISISEALNQQLESAASAIGIWTDGWESNIKRIQRDSAAFLAEETRKWQQFIAINYGTRPSDAPSMLKQLAEDAKLARIELEGLYKIEEIRRRATMSTQDMLKQDALDAIDQSGMSEAEKIRARQDVISTDERTRLEIRGQERESRANQSRDSVTTAEADLAEKKRIEEQQAARARAYSSAMATVEDNKRTDPKADAKGIFENTVKQLGFADMRFGVDQMAALTDATKARREAEEKLREAELRDRKNREVIAEEQRIDESTTINRIQRGEQSADSRARALEEAGQKQPEDPTSPEYNREGEDMVRQSLLEAAQKTGNAATKAEVEQLARAFADNNTTAAETQQLTQLIDQLKSTGTQAATALAGKLSEAMGVIAQNQQQFNAAMQNLDSRVKQLEQNSATQ